MKLSTGLKKSDMVTDAMDAFWGKSKKPLSQEIQYRPQPAEIMETEGKSVRDLVEEQGEPHDLRSVNDLYGIQAPQESVQKSAYDFSGLDAAIQRQLVKERGTIGTELGMGMNIGMGGGYGPSEAEKTERFIAEQRRKLAVEQIKEKKLAIAAERRMAHIQMSDLIRQGKAVEKVKLADAKAYEEAGKASRAQTGLPIYESIWDTIAGGKRVVKKKDMWGNETTELQRFGGLFGTIEDIKYRKANKERERKLQEETDFATKMQMKYALAAEAEKIAKLKAESAKIETERQDVLNKFDLSQWAAIKDYGFDVSGSYAAQKKYEVEKMEAQAKIDTAKAAMMQAEKNKGKESDAIKLARIERQKEREREITRRKELEIKGGKAAPKMKTYQDLLNEDLLQIAAKKRGMNQNEITKMKEKRLKAAQDFEKSQKELISSMNKAANQKQMRAANQREKATVLSQPRKLSPEIEEKIKMFANFDFNSIPEGGAISLTTGKPIILNQAKMREAELKDAEARANKPIAAVGPINGSVSKDSLTGQINNFLDIASNNKPITINPSLEEMRQKRAKAAKDFQEIHNQYMAAKNNPTFTEVKKAVEFSNKIESGIPFKPFKPTADTAETSIQYPKQGKRPTVIDEYKSNYNKTVAENKIADQKFKESIQPLNPVTPMKAPEFMDTPATKDTITEHLKKKKED